MCRQIQQECCAWTADAQKKRFIDVIKNECISLNLEKKYRVCFPLHCQLVVCEKELTHTEFYITALLLFCHGIFGGRKKTDERRGVNDLRVGS